MFPERKYTLPKFLVEKLVKLPETRMGIHILTVETKTGTKYPGVVVTNCNEIIGIYGFQDLPFNPADLTGLEVTHRTEAKNFDPSQMTYFKENRSDQKGPL